MIETLQSLKDPNPVFLKANHDNTYYSINMCNVNTGHFLSQNKDYSLVRGFKVYQAIILFRFYVSSLILLSSAHGLLQNLHSPSNEHCFIVAFVLAVEEPRMRRRRRWEMDRRQRFAENSSFYGA